MCVRVCVYSVCVFVWCSVCIVCVYILYIIIMMCINGELIGCLYYLSASEYVFLFNLM